MAETARTDLLPQPGRAKGPGYDAYAAGAGAYAGHYRSTYDRTAFTAAETAALAALAEPLTLYALVEVWCTDVMATLPVMARMAEFNPALSLILLPRPEHPEVARAYGAPGGGSRVPTYVLLDGRGRERGVLVERTPGIARRVQGYSDAVAAEIADRFPGVAKTDLPQDFVDEVLPKALANRAALHDQERAELVGWLTGAAGVSPP